MGAKKLNEITIGAHEYTVVAQPLAYLEMELGDVFAGLSGVDKPADLADVVTENATSTDTPAARQGFGEVAGPGYDILKVFIPDLMPEYEFRGFASEDAFANGVRDRAAARCAPTVPQVVEAFEVIFKVNRLDVVKHLGKVIPKGLVEKFLKQAIGDSVSALLLSSLPEPGASD